MKYFFVGRWFPNLSLGKKYFIPLRMTKEKICYYIYIGDNPLSVDKSNPQKWKYYFDVSVPLPMPRLCEVFGFFILCLCVFLF